MFCNNKVRLLHVRCSILLLIFLMISGSAWSAPDRHYAKLTILHTNDTHSHLLPFSYPEKITFSGETVKLPAYQNIGGIARRATLIRQIEKEQPDGVLVMDAGDVIDGSPFSVEFAGEAEIAAMNQAGYEVMTTGNHEYNNHISQFYQRIKEARFPILAANTFKKGESQSLITPYLIKEENGLKIAILGLVTFNDYTTIKEGGLEIKNPVEIAKQWVPELRKKADVVIVLSHNGFEEDMALAAQVPGIDVIIGGHSHTRVEKPVLVPQTKQPEAFWVGGTVVAQDFQWGGDLGRVDLIFHKGDNGWTLMSYQGKLIPITKDIPEDPAVHQIVEKFHQRIASKYDTKLTQATDDIMDEAAYNLVSDALRETQKADFAIHNYGGVRSYLVKGPVTYGAIADMIPFTNKVLSFSISGKQLKQMLLGSTPAVSNIRYQIKNRTLIRAEIGGKPIEDDVIYKGITHSFYAGYALPKEIQTTEVAATHRELVKAYLLEKKAISPDNEHRAVVQ